jgi:putative transposase
MSERTSLKYVYYALKLYSSGLSLRRTSQHLSLIIKRNHVSVWNWIQKYKPKKKIFQKRNKIQEFIVDETLIKVSDKDVWVRVPIEPIDK